MTVIDLGAWSCTRDQIELVRDASLYVDLQQQSAPVTGLRSLGDDADGMVEQAPNPLHLFAAVQHGFRSESATSGRWDGYKPRRTADGEPAACSTAGAVLYCGGPVWGLDWSPAMPAQHAGGGASSSGGAAAASSREDDSAAAEPSSRQFLAVAAHPRGRESNIIGRPVTGPGCVQLWEAHSCGVGSPRGKPGELLSAPTMAMAVCHDGGVAWDIKWCPCSPPPDDAGTPILPRVGWLAVALGSGDVLVAPVPDPAAVSRPVQQQQSRAGQQADRQQGGVLAVRLAPAVTLASARVGGSLAAALDWLPRPPHDLLLVGHWDGTAALWRLAPSAATQPGSAPFAPELQLHVRTNEGPVRSVAWAPAALEDGGDALAGRSVFMTAGHDGNVSIWDARDIYHPVWQIHTGVAFILSADWPAPSLPTLASTDNGYLHGVLPYPRTLVHQLGTSCRALCKSRTGGVWSVHAGLCPSGTVYAAYGCEDGLVYTLEAVVLRDPRVQHPTPTAICGWQQEGGALVLSDDRTLALATAAASISTKQPKAPAKGSAATAGTIPSPPLVAVHRVRWNAGANASGVNPGGGRASGSGAVGGQGGGSGCSQAAGWLAHGGAAGLVCIQRPLQ